MAYSENLAKLFPQILKESLDSGDTSHNDLMQWLCDAISDYAKSCGGGCWCYLKDFVGDGESGYVVFCCDGNLKKCDYEVIKSGDKMTVQLDDENVVDVFQTTSYPEEMDEQDHFASMEAAGLYTKGPVPLCERFISKSARDKMDPADFAGKGTSFPIKSQVDYDAAVQSVGRAGGKNFGSDTILKKADAIAKRKGLKLRKAAQNGDSKESALIGEMLVDNLAFRLAEAGANPFAKKAAQSMHDKAVKSGNQKSHDSAAKLGADCPDGCKLGGDDDADEAAAIEITGDVVSLREGAVGQDGTVLLKVIQPGWGSCGWYSEDVLERDLPKIYPAGTKNFWNHQTEAEEAARPEGDLRDLASVTTEPVKYLKDGPDGPGGYVKAKAFEAFKQPIEDLAKYIGTSIRASGKAKEGVAPDGKKGKIIEQLTHGLSIDYVTTPGAGGRVLQLFEAARGRAAKPPQPQESEQMTEAELKEFRELREANTKATAEIRKLKERDATRDAGTVVAAYLKTTNISEAIATRVTGRVLAGNIPLTESGDLDQEKLRKFAETQLVDELDFLKRLNPSLVQGMGPSTAAPAVAPKEAKKATKEAKREMKEADKRFASLMSSSQGTPLGKMGRKILTEGRAAFDVNYNARLKGVAVTGELGSLPQGMEA